MVPDDNPAPLAYNIVLLPDPDTPNESPHLSVTVKVAQRVGVAVSFAQRQIQQLPFAVTCIEIA